MHQTRLLIKCLLVIFTIILVSYFGAVSSAVVGSLGTAWVFKKLNAPSFLIRVILIII